MLYFNNSRIIAIIATALVVMLFAVPNFVPEHTVKTWPQWAQRHIVLGLDLQGGSHLLLEVDSNAVKAEKLKQVADDARRVLRDARIRFTGGIRPCCACSGDTLVSTIRNSILAVWPRSSFRRVGSCRPGTCTRMRSTPWR